MRLKLALLPILLVGFALSPSLVNAQVEKYPQITNQSCDLRNPCPKGLHCISFPNVRWPKCAEPHPHDYYKCPKGTSMYIAETYPPRVKCYGEANISEEEARRVVSYVIETGIIRVVEENETVSRNITVRKTRGFTGLLETPRFTAGYRGNLTVRRSKLFLRSGKAERPVNVLPDTAAKKARGIAETPNIGKIELRVEGGRATYSVKGAKPAKLFGIFPLELGIETKISAETGEKISVNRPLWSFLAW